MNQLAIEQKEQFLSTTRTDKWWFEPLWTGLGFLTYARTRLPVGFAVSGGDGVGRSLSIVAGNS